MGVDIAIYAVEHGYSSEESIQFHSQTLNREPKEGWLRGVDVGDERERRFVVAAKGAVATAIANGR